MWRHSKSWRCVGSYSWALEKQLYIIGFLREVQQVYGVQGEGLGF